MSTIKASDLKGRAVVSLAEAEKVGTVSSVIFDPSANKVVGLKVKTGLFGAAQNLRADDIRNIGPDAVTINDRTLLHEHDSEAPELKDMPTFEDLLSMKVVGDNGVLHGMLGDVEMNPDDMTITEYEMSGNLWAQLTRAERGFKAAPGIRYGKDLLIVPEVITQDLAGKAGGVAASMEPAGSSDEAFLPPPDNMPTLADTARVSPAPAAQAGDLPADAPVSESAPLGASTADAPVTTIMSTGEALPAEKATPIHGVPLREESPEVADEGPGRGETTT